MKCRVIAVSLLLLAACPRSREDYSQNSPAKTSTTTQPGRVTPNETKMNPIMPPQRDMPSRRAAASAAQTVDVQLIEYQVRMPLSLTPGQYTLNIVNSGHADHSFVIEGPNNLRVALAEPLKRGDSTQLGVELKSGTYQVYCPVDGHKGRGMTATVTVK